MTLRFKPIYFFAFIAIVFTLTTGKIMVGVHPRTEEDASYFENEWRNNNGQEIYR